MLFRSGTKYPKEAAALCQAVAELRCKYVYEEKGNPFTVYNAEKMEWKQKGEFADAVAQLADDMQNFGFVYGFVRMLCQQQRELPA